MTYLVTCGDLEIIVDAPDKAAAKSIGVMFLREKDRLWHYRGRVVVHPISSKMEPRS